LTVVSFNCVHAYIDYGEALVFYKSLKRS